ncbi:MAG: hypothetical protein ACI8Z1_002367 [Candidatus Azotimanducaceae bacterium]|jgi:uncharacterized protein YbgA (DUF1722 family)
MDARLRENCLERVFLYTRWRGFVTDGITSRGLVVFHTAQKYSMRADDEPIYRELGRIVANASKANVEVYGDQYIALLMQGMKKLTTPKKHVNVFMHIMGFSRTRWRRTTKRMAWANRSRSASRRFGARDYADYVDSLL